MINDYKLPLYSIVFEGKGDTEVVYRIETEIIHISIKLMIKVITITGVFSYQLDEIMYFLSKSIFEFHNILTLCV